MEYKPPIVIDNYNNAIDLLIKEFVRMYYTYDEDDVADRYIIEDWIRNAPYTVEVNDYYRNINDIYTAVNHKIPEDKLFEWYDYSLNKHQIKSDWWDAIIRNLYNFVYWEYIYTEEEKAEDNEKIKKARETLRDAVVDQPSFLDLYKGVSPHT